MDTPAASFSANEMMTVVAARALGNRDVCFVGIGAPSAACNLARLTHAPDITLIYESGTIGARPTVLPLSIGDGELCETALTTVSVPEMFRYWLQGGRITVGFLVRGADGSLRQPQHHRGRRATAGPRCACPAVAGRRRSPLAASRFSSPCRCRGAPSWSGCRSSPPSATVRGGVPARRWALRPRVRRGS